MPCTRTQFCLLTLLAWVLCLRLFCGHSAPEVQLLSNQEQHYAFWTVNSTDFDIKTYTVPALQAVVQLEHVLGQLDRAMVCALLGNTQRRGQDPVFVVKLGQPSWTRWTLDPSVIAGNTTHDIIAQVLSLALHELLLEQNPLRCGTYADVGEFVQRLRHHYHPNVRQTYKHGARWYQEKWPTSTRWLIEHAISDTLKSVRNLWLESGARAPQRYYNYAPSSPQLVVDADMQELLQQYAYFNLPTYVDGVWIYPRAQWDMIWAVLASGAQQDPYRKYAVTVKGGKVMQFIEHDSDEIDPMHAHETMHEGGIAARLYAGEVLRADPQSCRDQGCEQKHCIHDLPNMSHVLWMDQPGGPLLSQWIVEHGWELQDVSFARRLVHEMLQVIKSLRGLGLVHTKAGVSKWIMLPTGKLQLRDPEGMVASSELELCTHGVIPEFEALLHTDVMGSRLQEMAPVFYAELNEHQKTECSHVDVMAWAYAITVVWPFWCTVYD